MPNPADPLRAEAVRLNQRAWALLATPENNDGWRRDLVEAAIGSFALWNIVGADVHRQRGSWLVARAAAEAGWADLARVYAARCTSLTTIAEGLSDFDRVYAREAEARAAAVSGDLDAADRLRADALSAAAGIADTTDRNQVLEDIAAGNWGPRAPDPASDQ